MKLSLKVNAGRMWSWEKRRECNVEQGKEISNWQKVGFEGGGRNCDRYKGIHSKGDTEKSEFMVKGNPPSNIGNEHKESWHSAWLACY